MPTPRNKPAVVANLVPLVYQELRRLARRFMKRERSGHTLQTTALVHEPYLKLIGKGKLEWNGRTHFIGITAHAGDASLRVTSALDFGNCPLGELGFILTS